MSLRVLLATEASEGLGHVAPWRGLLETLIAHGHVVTMACPQAALAQSLLGDTGAKVLQAWWPSMHASAILESSYCWEDLLWSLGYGSSKAVAACTKYWASLFDSEKPDVILADYAPLAMVIAKARGIPVIEAGGGFCVPPARAGQPSWLPHIRQLNPSLKPSREWIARAEHRGRCIAQAFNLILPSEAGLPEFNAIYRSASVRCVTSSQELDHYASWRLADDVEYLGALKLSSLGVDPDASAPDWARAATKGLKLLCYLKENTPGIDEILTQLVSSMDLQILIIGLSRSRAKQLCSLHGEVPSHIHISEQALDFSKAIDLADVFLTNGGIHSLSHALNSGKQCLIVPSQAEQASMAVLLRENPLIGIIGHASHLQAQLLQIKRMERKRQADLSNNLYKAELSLLALIDKVAC